MRRRSGKGARSAARATSVLLLAAAVACSGSNKSFFDAPPISLGAAGKAGTAGAHSSAGSSGKAAQAGIGGKGGTEGAGATSGNGDPAGGAPDATGGEGDVTGTAGDESTGGRGGTGGGARGGATAAGGSGGHVTQAGGSSGTGGTGGDVTPGGGLGGSAGTGASGGLGAAGLGGLPGTGGSTACVPTASSDEICDGVDNDCDGQIDGPGVCPDGCHGAVDSAHRYLLCTGPGDTTYTRTEAHNACGDYGDSLGITLDLVRVNSYDEDAFVVGLLNEYYVTGDVWNGASDSSTAGSTEGTWVWGTTNNGVTFYKDGAPVMMRYNHWAAGQPDDDAPSPGEDCAVFDPDLDWAWDDVACSRDLASFVCEEPTN